MIYKFCNKSLKPINTEGKNNLERGRILHLNGYSDPDYVIIQNMGINENYSYYGARYSVISLNDYTEQLKDAYTLKFLSEKVNNAIQMYITDEVLPETEILQIMEKAKIKKNKETEKKQKEITQLEKWEAEGRELFRKYIPDTAKALIVAVYEIDDCEIMSDYFNTKSKETVIIGYSTHTRDIFSEMRKHAHLIPEIKHLAIAPDVNRNGENKNDINKSRWHPADEHREKYSMGAGYYLKASGRYSTGWKIEKIRKWRNEWEKKLYIAMAKRCIFGGHHKED